jgi:hypothetical protein
MNIVQFAVGNIDKAWSVAAQIKQRASSRRNWWTGIEPMGTPTVPKRMDETIMYWQSPERLSSGNRTGVIASCNSVGRIKPSAIPATQYIFGLTSRMRPMH